MYCLDNLASKVENCQQCVLYKSRTHVVFSRGATTAPLFLVGEAPGREEDESGLPFVGKSGKLLDRLLEEASLCRDTDVYIANIVKCRPPQNRAPQKSEISCCLPFLRQQIQLINPKLIVCVGRVAAQTLIDPHFKIMTDHGRFFSYGTTPITATLHPAAILRNINNIQLARQDWRAISSFCKGEQTEYTAY